MKSRLYPFCVGLVFVLLSYGTYQGLVAAPSVEELAAGGEAQRIFYYHVPAAIAAYTLFFLNFAASLIYLWKRSPAADAFAVSTAEVGVVFATATLALGMIWARYAWGHWWAWDMRLTTFLVLWLLYVSYLVLRRAAESGSSPVMAAALAIIIFLDVPFNYMANRWFRGNHPEPVTLTSPALVYALMANMIAFLAFAGVIVWFRYALERVEQRIALIHAQRATQGGFSLALPAALWFQSGHGNPIHYTYAGYTAAWVIYIGYLLLLTRKVARLKRDEEELRGKA
jgi:heme exporter protein C